MPAGDGTGPMGMGPMTGRAAGYCAGFGRVFFGNSSRERIFCHAIDGRKISEL